MVMDWCDPCMGGYSVEYLKEPLMYMYILTKTNGSNPWARVDELYRDMSILTHSFFCELKGTRKKQFVYTCLC